MTSRFLQSLAAWGGLGLLLLAPAMALGDDDLDVTMRMVTDDAALTESVVREIELREPVALEQRRSRSGEQAREARNSGQETARSAAERAREARQRNERFEIPGRPDAPGRPERPEQPELR